MFVSCLWHGALTSGIKIAENRGANLHGVVHCMRVRRGEKVLRCGGGFLNSLTEAMNHLAEVWGETRVAKTGIQHGRGGRR